MCKRSIGRINRLACMERFVPDLGPNLKEGTVTGGLLIHSNLHLLN